VILVEKNNSTINEEIVLKIILAQDHSFAHQEVVYHFVIPAVAGVTNGEMPRFTVREE
jgi:hypothetical protein